MTEPESFGLQGLHVSQQKSCFGYQVMLLVNISSPECNFLRTSKPWFLVIESPNFMLIPFSLFLYLTIETLLLIGLLLKKCTCSPIFPSVQADYNPLAWYENWLQAMGLYQPSLPWCDLDLLVKPVCPGHSSSDVLILGSTFRINSPSKNAHAGVEERDP
jgi:hypothetical protein